MKPLISRTIATLVILVAFGLVEFLLNPVSTVMTARAAAMQFENSDVAYIESIYGMRFFSTFGLPILLTAVLAFVWWGPLCRALRGQAVPVLAGLCALLSATGASAYYDKIDYSEAYFFIPDAGASRDSQVKFGSAEYLKANKVAAKRFVRWRR